MRDEPEEFTESLVQFTAVPDIRMGAPNQFLIIFYFSLQRTSLPGRAVHKYYRPGVRLMLFMVIEHFASGQAPEVYRRFRDRGRMAPEGLRYISSWVDLNFERCFQLMEARGVEVLTEWIANWDDLIDFEIVPVRTSEEAAAVIAPQL